MKFLKFVCVVVVFTSLVPCMAAEQIELSLRQREEKGEMVLDILVSNVSKSSLKIVSEGIAPPWSISAWFTWEIDGNRVEYSENVAIIPHAKEIWMIPPEGTVLWASIPLRSLKCVVDNELGQKELRSVIQDKRQHVVVIHPTDRWQGMTVGSGRVAVGEERTEKANPVERR